jgi:hypothetical protein
MQKYQKIVLLISLILFLSCNSKPSQEIEQEWQQSFRKALINGYTNFKGHFVDADASVYIFSYQFPAKLPSKEIFSILWEQIKGYNVISESKDELVLRRSGTFQTHEVFDEYRFLINEQRGKIIVMFARLNSLVKMKNHPFFIKKFQKAHHTL